jgi:uncharacterized protein with HEPN domain
MRHEESYLDDLLEACDDIAEFIAGVAESEFADNKLIRSAVLQKVIVLGEVAFRLPAEFKAAHPEVDWAAIAGMRHRLVHGYFEVEWPIVWVAASDEAPELRQQIAQILHSEFGESS